MTIATEIVQKYRLALIDLWNQHFWNDQGFRDWESVKDFERVQPLLFQGLVARRLEPLGEGSTKIFGTSFRVVPASQTMQIPTMYAQTNSLDALSLNWEHLSGPFSANQVNLSLIDFFDWNVHHWRDFRYYRVRIHGFENKPELVGRDGLIDVLDADVMWNVSD